mgnify:CR=1 FL=1
MKNIERPDVEIYADGACKGNPGVGGYGIILKSGEKEKELSGCMANTTNNRMELTAVIKGLEALKVPCNVTVFTDSNYIIKGMTEWVHSWVKNQWKNSQKKDVQNRDLWEKLLELSRVHNIKWKWIRGHAGHDENERCDKIARLAIKKCID